MIRMMIKIYRKWFKRDKLDGKWARVVASTLEEV